MKIGTLLQQSFAAAELQRKELARARAAGHTVIHDEIIMKGETDKMNTKQINDGGPAYPDGSTNSWGNANDSGLSKRDAFALSAMQGMITAVPWEASLDEKVIAQCSYFMADAMLAARTSQAAPDPAPTLENPAPATAQWYAELLELLGATCQTDAKHLINELVAVKIDEAEARATVALYRALGVRDQEAALAKIKELTP